MTGQYIVVSKLSADYDKIISQSEAYHKALHPINELAVSDLGDDTVLIKVGGLDKEWYTKFSWKNEVKNFFNNEQKELRQIFYYEKVSEMKSKGIIVDELV